MAASVPCAIHLPLTSKPSSSSPTNLGSRFLGIRGGSKLGWARPAGIGPQNDRSRATCLFKFGKNGVDAVGAGIYGSQSRDDYSRYDVEQYYEYMGMLAAEGSYDNMEAMLSQNIHPVDILLMMAATEADKPKIEELLRAGAKFDVKDSEGRTAVDRAADEEIRDLILGFSVQKA